MSKQEEHRVLRRALERAIYEWRRDAECMTGETSLQFRRDAITAERIVDRMQTTKPPLDYTRGMVQFTKSLRPTKEPHAPTH